MAASLSHSPAIVSQLQENGNPIQSSTPLSKLPVGPWAVQFMNRCRFSFFNHHFRLLKRSHGKSQNSSFSFTKKEKKKSKLGGLPTCAGCPCSFCQPAGWSQGLQALRMFGLDQNGMPPTTFNKRCRVMMGKVVKMLMIEPPLGVLINEMMP